MSVYDEYRTIQDQLIKVQRDARKALDRRRAELAVAGVEREIRVWEQIRDTIATEPVDFDKLIDLLVEAETLEHAKKRDFYL